MFNLNVLQAQWVILAMLGGAVLALAVFLYYLTPGRAEDKKTASEQTDAEYVERSSHRRVPWILILLFVITAIYSLIYVYQRSSRPPNW
jgi:hypothetical protein